MKLSFPVECFLERAATDGRLLPTHISLFMAIFYYSIADNPKASFRVSRRKLMQFSRLRSTSTYHRCLSDLVSYGYITYKPTYDPFRASMISLVDLE
jgi:hypothetical protein